MTTPAEAPVPVPDLLQALAEQRELLLITVRGITDAQAARRTTSAS
ncbi:hypothetical protein ACLGIH_32380 [Streptomyces sp. HMX87]